MQNEQVLARKKEAMRRLRGAMRRQLKRKQIGRDTGRCKIFQKQHGAYVKIEQLISLASRRRDVIMWWKLQFDLISKPEPQKLYIEDKVTKKNFWSNQLW